MLRGLSVALFRALKESRHLLPDDLIEERVGQMRVQRATELERNGKVERATVWVRRHTGAEPPIAHEMREELAVDAHGFHHVGSRQHDDADVALRDRRKSDLDASLERIAASTEHVGSTTIWHEFFVFRHVGHDFKHLLFRVAEQPALRVFDSLGTAAAQIDESPLLLGERGMDRQDLMRRSERRRDGSAERRHGLEKRTAGHSWNGEDVKSFL